MYRILVTLLGFYHAVYSAGILYPRDSETRTSISLSGVWDFALSNDTKSPFRGHSEEWYEKGLRSVEDLEVKLMAVPASYNDIGAEADVRDYYGLAWYEKKFFVPKDWEGKKVWIRFGSVCRAAEVWINGKSAVTHSIGHLPFQADVSQLVNYQAENTISVAVDNTLLEATIPQGSITTLDSGRTVNTYTFDFFNYAGIDRPVTLHTTPSTYIDDLLITTALNGDTGVVNYVVTVVGDADVTAHVTVFDQDDNEIAASDSLSGAINVPEAKLWWPYLMDPNPGYQYKLQVELLSSDGTLTDKYVQPFGIRTVTWDSTSVNINGKPIYMRGFGKHEDSDVRGKGFDLPLILRDYNLIEWIGANAFRTSHYPYAEEIMDLADELGIMVIDESPAVNTEKFSDELLANHKLSLTELVNRDKNRPSVIIWSAANEPRTQYDESEEYYKQVVAHLRSLDGTRPVTVVNNQQPDVDHSGQFIDVACFNLYKAWYESSGDLDVIIPDVNKVARRWHEKHNIPVIITEYGGDTVEGFHQVPAYIWSEEFQTGILNYHFQAFDQMRAEKWFIGEMIWNFADFKTAQTLRRVGGNRKGIFNRQRQPKAAAHLMRKRYWSLAHALDGADIPDDLFEYIYDDTETHDEL